MTRQKRASKHRCHTRASGYPVRCGLSNQSQAPLEYWIVRSSRTMTGESAAASMSSQTRCSTPQRYTPESFRHSPSSHRATGGCARTARSHILADFLDTRARGMPGAAPAGGARIQNIENNPMQSSFGGRWHARSREDILTQRCKRAGVRQIGTTGKLRMARMRAAPVGLIYPGYRLQPRALSSRSLSHICGEGAPQRKRRYDSNRGNTDIVARFGLADLKIGLTGHRGPAMFWMLPLSGHRADGSTCFRPDPVVNGTDL